MKIRAAVLERFGEPLEVQELELAEPRAGEVLVRLVACGVQYDNTCSGNCQSNAPVFLACIRQMATSDCNVLALCSFGLALTGLGYSWGDSVAAVAVAIMIAALGLRLARSTVETLLDRAPEGASE